MPIGTFITPGKCKRYNIINQPINQMTYLKTLLHVGWLHFQVLGDQSEKSTSLVLDVGKLFLSYTTQVCKPGQFESLFK